jgi:TolB-like protein
MAALCLAATGCATDPNEAATGSVTPGASPYQQLDLSTLTYRAVDLILASAPEVSADTPLVVASLSNAKTLETSSALGNIVADMIRTRLAQTGHNTSEVRLRSAMSLKKDNGEFLLSRNRSALMSAPIAAAVVTGTYATSYEKVYVSIKLISANDAHIVAGADFVVPLGDVLGLIDEHGT